MKKSRRGGQSRSPSASAKTVRFPATGVIGGWTGAQKSSSRNLTANSYLGQVRNAIGPDAYDEFTTLVDSLGGSNEFPANQEDKMATIERLITLLEGHPRLTLNLTIFLPDEYLIEVQRDAVVIKVYESDSSLTSVDTGHSRSIDNTPRSSWAWMGHTAPPAKAQSPPPPGTPGKGKRPRSPGKRKSSSPRRSRSSPPSARTARPRTARSRPDPNSQRSAGESVKGEVELVEGDAQKSNRDDVYLVELNDSATDTRTIDYVRTVKRIYASRPDIYRRFVEILSERRTGSLTDKVGEVVALFKARPSLILGFNEFLPIGCRIVQLDEKEPGTRGQAPTTSKYAIEVKDAMGKTVQTVLDD